MALTQAQKSMIEKARAGGGSEQGITLDDASCASLVAVAANDLGISNHFPADCKSSGFIPVLIVLDATPNQKLEQLEQIFLAHRGEVYKGAEAWAHLDSVAGPTMALFLEKYVRTPIQAILTESSQGLPDFTAHINGGNIILSVGGESLTINRRPAANDGERDSLPDDVSDEIGGP